MLPKIIIEEKQALGLQFEKHWINELHHIIIAHARQEGVEFCHEKQTAHKAWLSRYINIPFITLPEVAIGDYRDLMSQFSQAIGKGGMNITIFAYK
jgi:hypothetical protein